MNPIVSVFCLCYNQSKFIFESLESIKYQSFQNFEILIVDDFSKDDSAQIIDNWITANPELKITFIKHQKNEGICKSLNELLEISEGKYVQMLALDDVLLPWKLEKHVEILDKAKSNEVLVFSDALLMDDSSNLYQNMFIAYHYKYLNIETGNFFETLVSQNFIPAMSVLIKKEAIVHVGGWDEDLAYEDYDMWLRLSKKGDDFIFFNEASCIYRLHKHNTHKNIEIMNSNIFDILIKHYHNRVIAEKIEYILERDYLEREDNKKAKIYYSLNRPRKISKLIIKYGYPRLIFRIFNRLNL